MDKKKKINLRNLFTLLFCAWTGISSIAQTKTINKVVFCGAETGNANDSITLKYNLLDDNEQRIKNFPIDSLNRHMQIDESGQPIQTGAHKSASGVRIPKETTISVLIDRGIEKSEKDRLYEQMKTLVESAPDSCVYISFFDEKVTKSKQASANNYQKTFEEEFKKDAQGKNYFYSALYSKLLEFNKDSNKDNNYDFEESLCERAEYYDGKVVVFVFVAGNRDADSYDPLGYTNFVNNVRDLNVKPTIYAFYYTERDGSSDEDLILTLKNVTGESKDMHFPEGTFIPSEKQDTIIKKVGEAIEDQTYYDYTYVYKVKDNSIYNGNAVSFSAKWDNDQLGDDWAHQIGTEETPWPNRPITAVDIFLAFFVIILTIVIVFTILKVLVPFVKSKIFEHKYYNRYKPEFGVQKRICSYCKQPIEAGQMVVTKCKHIMHVHCWKENDYQCAEYGQNCNVGIQEHVNWKKTFTKTSLRDCHQAISGIFAGFAAWIIYELAGCRFFSSLASGIANLFLIDESQRSLLLQTCTSKVASFLAIGLLLGFFLSFVFRWNDEYRRKNSTIIIKIIGLSLLSALIGLLAFAFGGIILCMLVSSINATALHWYCSLPAYILFSICTSLSLTIKSSIPVKSAMLGGLGSAIIGFLVLYFTKGNANKAWMNMLLNFIIYGGGLGASLQTVRMLAEKYFLVIKNGVKAGTRIPIHKWMSATGGGNRVTIGMTGDCEIQMNWEKSNKVAKEHAVLYIDQARSIPVVKPLAINVIYNSRAELPVRRPVPLNNGDTIKIGDTIFVYEEMD